MSNRARRARVGGTSTHARASRAARPEATLACRGTVSVFLMTVAGCLKAGIERPASPSRRLALGLTLLALVACAPQRVTIVPEGLQGLAPFCAQVDPHLLTLTERWVTGGTAGEVPVGELLRQVLVDDPQASLRLMYVTSQLDVATVVSPTFYRPRAYQARYRLTVRVESPAIGVRQSWLHAVGESRNLVSAARATNDAITQAVREFYGQLAAVQNVRAAFGKLRFKTAYEQQLWEECSRLVTNSIIYDNATILSQLVAYKAHQGDQHSAALLTQVSPIAWQHMNLCGRYEFTGEPEAIHMPAIIQALVQVPVTQDCALYTLDYTSLGGWAKIPMWCSHMAFDLHSGRSVRFRGYVFRRFNHFPPAGFVAVDTVLNHG